MKLLDRGRNFARFEFGEISVIALRDGYVDLPADALRHHGGQPLRPLPKQVQLVDGKLRLSVNAFVVIDGKQVSLIDTGASNTWDVTMGLLPSALSEAKVAQESITTVFLTHSHRDHVGGLIGPHGSTAFPNLEAVFVAREDMHALDDERYAPVRGLCVPIAAGQQVGDRITAIDARGHSPGDTAFQIDTSAGRLLAWGDVVSVPSIQFSFPEVTWMYDHEQDKALQIRRQMFRQAATAGVFVAGAHLDFPGVGHLEVTSGSYVFKS